MKFMLCLTIFTVAAVMVSAEPGVDCDNCVMHEQCDLVKDLDAKVLNAWSNLHSCTHIFYKGNLMPVTKGIYVCCSESLLSKYLDDLNDILS